MITIALTYRNRDLNIVKICLESLQAQTNSQFQVILVDYGSQDTYKKALQKLIQNFSFVKLLQCETQYQLWCKSRAINLALKQCETPYFLVGDVDMIYHSNFIKTLHEVKKQQEVIYFQVGFLNEAESKQHKEFNNYQIKFKSKEEATGITLFNSEVLKSINGYDEFYHGWGGEDTDVHVRLKNAGYNVHFYSESLLMLHQWHPKQYREVNDLTPFHTSLELINHQYLEFTKQTKKVKANDTFKWGRYNETDYSALKTSDFKFQLTNKEAEIKAFISNILLSEIGKIVTINIKNSKDYNSLKQKTKKVLGKKTVLFLEMQLINNMLLECIINNLRNNAYKLQYNLKAQTINLTIKL